ncbi:hypothetical protein [Pseudonocardia sp. GCM10023141]
MSIRTDQTIRLGADEPNPDSTHSARLYTRNANDLVGADSLIEVVPG